MKQILLKTWLIVVCLLCGVGIGWGAEGDTHDFTQTLSQLLNNSASISSIEIPAQSYPVKEVKVTWNYNKSNSEVVTIAVKVGTTDFGSAKVGTSTTSTNSFTGTSTTGAVTISFTNHAGSGTGKGTFKVTNVQLVEGASSGSTPTALTVPTNLSSSNVTTTGATLSWDAVANASSYTVKIGDTEHTGVNTNSYSATGLTAGTPYTWTVKAVGDGSSYSTSDYAANANFTTEAEQGGGDEPSGNNLIITYGLNDKSNYPQGIPASKPSSSNSESSGTYSIGGNDLSINASSGEFFYIINSSKTDASCGLFLGKTATNNNVPKDGTAYLGFPAKAGYKLTKVVATTTNGIGGSISLNIYSTRWDAMSTALSTTPLTSSEFTFELTNPEANTEYRLASGTSSKNLQFNKIVLTYEPAGPAEISNLIKTSSANLYVGDEIDDLNTYLNLPNDYAGSVTFSSTSENVMIDGKYLLATGTDEATINVTAAANGNYLETEGTITLNISKKTPVLTWGESKTSYTIFNLANNNENKFVGQTATATEGGSVKYRIEGTGASIDEDGVVTISGVGAAIVTAYTEGNNSLNAAEEITYTLNVVDPSISITPADGVVTYDNNTVTFTGNGMAIDYLCEDPEALDSAEGTSNNVAITKNCTIVATITDDADNKYSEEFAVKYLANPELLFSAESQSVSMKDAPFAALELTKCTDAAEVTYSLDITGDDGNPIASIDEESGVITLSGTKATSSTRKVYVVASTPATENYAAGVARYELIINKLDPQLAWSESSITLDLNEEDKLPTLSNPKGLTVTYDSSNKEVADFNDGVLELKKAGRTIISASISTSAYYDATTVTYELTFAPTYTVTFSINGEETVLREETTGAGVTAPAVEPILGKVFRGWAETAIDGTTATKPSLVANAGKSLIENKYYYAVFANVSEGEDFELVENLANINDGEAYIGSYLNYSGSRYYVATSATDLVNATVTDKVLTIPANAMKLTFVSTGTANEFYIKNEAGDFLNVTSSDWASFTSTACALNFSGSSPFALKTSTGNNYLRAYGSSTTAGKLKRYASQTNTGLCVFQKSKEYSDYCTNIVTEYTRDGLTPNSLGTICIPYAVSADEVAKVAETVAFYEISHKVMDGETVKKVMFTPATELVAGKPYIFYTEAESFTLQLNGPATAAGNKNGLYGALTKFMFADTYEAGKYYVISSNKIQAASRNSGVNANRAYIIMNEVPAEPTAESAGRLLSIGANGFEFEEGILTGVEATITERSNEIYDLQGRRVVNAKNGMYIVNGKKVIR